MDGFERRKEQKKDDIRKAALDLFMQYGFKKVSIHDISGKANVSPVTIYNHFGSKDNLVRDVIKKRLTQMLDTYQAVIDGEGSFPAKLKQIVFDKVEIASQFRGELASVFFSSDPEMQKFQNDVVMERSRRMTAQLFDEGKREGYVGRDMSDETLIIYLEILRNGIAANTRLYEDNESYPRLVRELNELILFGLVDTSDRDEFHLERQEHG